MNTQVVGHWILAFVVTTTFLWLDLLSAEMLWRVALFTLVWSLASILLVAMAGAWIALSRARQRRSWQ